MIKTYRSAARVSLIAAPAMGPGQQDRSSAASKSVQAPVIKSTQTKNERAKMAC